MLYNCMAEIKLWKSIKGHLNFIMFYLKFLDNQVWLIKS